MRPALLVLLLVRSLSLYAAEECVRAFATAPHYTINSWHPFVAVDLDDDGRSEIVMPGAYSEIVAAGYANGGFDQRQVLTNIYYHGITDAVAADVDGDGGTDVITLVWRSLISVVANGDGTFRQIATPLGDVSVLNGRVFAGDFNGDQWIDVAVLDYHDPWMQIAIGKGDGSFTVRPPIALPRAMHGAAVIDIDGNGKDDVVLVDRVELAVYSEGGAARGTRTISGEPWSVTVADFDRDGRNDLVAGSLTEATVFLSTKEWAVSTTVVLPLGTEYSRVPLLAADFTGDGRADIVAHSVASRDMTLLVANADGTFSTGRSFAVGTESGMHTIAADFDGDGDQDLATSGTSAFQVALNRGDGVFDAAPSYAARNEAGRLAIGDLNHDGRDDLIVLGGGVDFRLSGSGGLLGEQQTVALPAAVSAGVIHDFNGDGHADLFAAGWETFLIAGKGDGTFQAPLTIPSYDHWVSDVAKGDMNNDGHMDVLVAYEFGIISLFRSRGDGTFARSEYFLKYHLERMKLADMNEDGFLDVVLTASNPLRKPRLVVVPGFGRQLGGAWDAGVDFAREHFLEVFDTDGDGHLDVVSVAADGDALLVLHGRGDGTFLLNRIPYDFFGSWGIVATDLTGDGIIDLVLGTSGFGELLAMEGDGKGGFTEIWREVTRRNSHELAIGDFNGDGLGEVAQLTDPANKMTNRVQIFSNICAVDRPARPILRLTVEDVTSYGATFVATLSEAAEGAIVDLYDRLYQRIGTATIVNGAARFVIGPYESPITHGKYWAYFVGQGRLTRARSNTVVAQPVPRRRATRH
ncbi:MAG: VCBS repeat-containing protein [Acidobacteriota bacterium]|nr:VCBS repeat-containing protein [Acidobacteriota bacterium]